MSTYLFNFPYGLKSVEWMCGSADKFVMSGSFEVNELF